MLEQPGEDSLEPSKPDAKRFCAFISLCGEPQPHGLRPRISPRPISIRQLHALPRFHSEPIHLVTFKGSYPLHAAGNLILRGASRLDAFSAYPFRTWLPSGAPGGTTGKIGRAHV